MSVGEQAYCCERAEHSPYVSRRRKTRGNEPFVRRPTHHAYARPISLGLSSRQRFEEMVQAKAAQLHRYRYLRT